MSLIKSAVYQGILQRAARVPGLRRLWRTLIWAFGLIYFGFIIAILVLRYSILPQIENHRPAIEKRISEEIGQSVKIGRIEASWDGINPDLTLFDVTIVDAEGRPALVFSKVEAILSWWSIPTARLELALLSIDQPSLNVRRDTRGQFFVAGMPIATEGSNNDVSDWVLAQKRIRIHGATLIWNDEQRSAPELVLKNVNFGLDNRGKRHRVGLTATPPENYASEIDFRGEFRGKNAEEMERGSGSAYAEIKHADLAIWRHWVDYPFALPRGQGGVRTWFSFGEGRLKEITADLSLNDVDLRLGETLAPIELLKMDGRLTLTLPDNGFQGEAKNLHLLAKPAAVKTNAKASKEAGEEIKFDVRHFQFFYQPPKDGKKQLGRITLSPADTLDIGRLARLASYLPLDETIHQKLVNLSPQGRLSDLAAEWEGDAEHLNRYSLKAKFSDLALNAQDAIPGFGGLSGSMVLNEQGGNLALDSTRASIDLPAVFSESLVEFDALKTEARWRVKKTASNTALNVESFKLEFSGKEIDGVAQGSYLYNGDGPGTIDLKASLTRGDARAVWRFIPQAVSKEARMWLKDSLLSGNSPDTQLALKGDLKDFPFLDKSKGTFFVDVKAEDVVLDYANGWPKIEGIRGKLRFEGNGMTIKIDSGKLLGAKVSNTTHAEVADFDIDTPILQVKGEVDGATAEFLKFIDKSPVSGKIDRFTENMRASGKGRLDLSLTIPLDEAKLDQSKIDGKYTFSDDEVSFDPDFPPIKKVNGHLRFTESSITIPQIDGQLLGGGIKISSASQGNAVIVATGKISATEIGKQYSLPLLDKLSGSTEYRAEITVNKRDADLILESNLIGLSSTLPAPFAKQAGEALALRVQKKALPSAPPQSAKNKSVLPAARDQLGFSLGDIVSGQIMRKKQEGSFLLERGAVVVGQALTLPESGLLFAVSAKSLDLDVWNSLLTQPSAVVSIPAGAKNTAKPSPEAAMPFTQIKLKTPDLLLYGNHFTDVDLSAVKGVNTWNAHLESAQASGNLQWESSGRGKLTARFKRLNIDSSTETESAISGDAVAELPAIDLIADDFNLGEKKFGRLEFLANNERNLWRIEKINATNPYATLSGKGFWQTGARRNRTQLDFKLESSDVGKLLERFAHPGTMQGGSVRLEGQIDWNGPPTSLDFSSLGGDMDLEATRGQFVKINPGAGKLLGLLSLQSLPRRITLDFKDVFSDGFAFEKISSKLKIKNGLMQTERLQLDGPAAKVLMRGEVDLKNETQNLRVTVQPELGGTAALGIAFINPIAGAATWAASQLFQNPLNQLFGFDYSITGTWNDPKIEKLGKNELPSAPRLPLIDNAQTSP